MKREPIEKLKEKLQLKDLPDTLPKVYQEICCPSCDNGVPADNININDKIAKCGQCNIVFPFYNEVASFEASKHTPKQDVARPEGIEKIQFQNELEFMLDQPTPVLDIIILMFAPFFAMLFTLVMVTKGKPLLWLIIPLALLSIYSTINIIRKSRNKIHINIDDNHLSVQWRPKNFHKDKHFAITEIEQLYTKVNPTYGLHGLYMIVNGINGQKHVPIIPYFDHKSKAKYLEQEIERQLNIPDRPVIEEN